MDNQEELKHVINYKDKNKFFLTNILVEDLLDLRVASITVNVYFQI
jgi:hypothetical protein